MSSNSIRQLVLVGVTLFLLIEDTLLGQQLKIAVVDMQQAVAETVDGEKAIKQLQTLKDRYQKELNEREQKLLSMRDEIVKQKDILTKDALEKRQEAWLRERAEAEKLLWTYQQELLKKEQELIGPIRDKLLAILQEIAVQRGYHLVIDVQAGVWYYTKALDLTGEIVRIYNERKGKKPEKEKSKK